MNESTANPRMLILHEVMGRDCGYLTAKTAQYYRQKLAKQDLGSPIFPSNATSRDIHAVWIPELKLDLLSEGARLKKVMDENGCVNVFFGEGTGVEEIVRDMESVSLSSYNLIHSKKQRTKATITKSYFF